MLRCLSKVVAGSNSLSGESFWKKDGRRKSVEKRRPGEILSPTYGAREGNTLVSSGKRECKRSFRPPEKPWNRFYPQAGRAQMEKVQKAKRGYDKADWVEGSAFNS